MATGDRSKRLKTNVQRVLGDLGEFKEESSSKAVYDALNRVQRRVCEEAHCLESSEELFVFSGQETYDFPDGMIHERMIIPPGSTQLKHISFEEVDRLKRSAQPSESVTDTTADNLFFYYKWENRFGFLLSDGTSPNSSVTLTVYFWRYPSSTEEISDTKDPLVENKWDTTLFYGAVAELSGEDKWWVRYETELNRLSRKEVTARSEPSRIPVTNDYDG